MTPGGIGFFILLVVAGAIVGSLVTLFVLRRKEGTQRGEAELERVVGGPLDRLLGALERNTNATAQNTLANNAPAVAADIKAATAALALANASNGATAAPAAPPAAAESTPGDETPIQWAARTKAVPPGELVAFEQFASTARATVSYADILTAYKAVIEASKAT